MSNGDSIVTQIFKFGFPFIGTALIVLWAVLLSPRPNSANHQHCVSCGCVISLPDGARGYDCFPHVVNVCHGG